MRFLFLILFLVAAPAHLVSAQEAPVDAPKNVILFIADGFGPAMSTMARTYQRDVLGGPDELVMDNIEVGSIRTYSTSSRVTDSAAGATAFATGVKSYNGSIAVDTTRAPLGTLLEAAHTRGMLTGIVSTTRVTHATPAAFTAHVPRRASEADIAEQQIHSGADLILGGGRRNFLPESMGGIRDDDRNVLEDAVARGYTVTSTWDETLNASLPLLALLDESSLSYDIDREDDEPSLAELTRFAIDRLSASDDGFFVMIEAARIDHAAHSNDIAGTLHDVLAYDEALAVALEFVEADGNTLLVAVADHETGGMSLGRSGQYEWKPEVLHGIRSSHGPMIRAIEQGGDIADVIANYTGLNDLTEDEIDALNTGVAENRLNWALADVIGNRAGIGWTTGGHTAVDVKLFAAGPGRDLFIGNHDNTYPARVIADLLDLDLAAETQRLRASSSASVLQD